MGNASLTMSISDTLRDIKSFLCYAREINFSIHTIFNRAVLDSPVCLVRVPLYARSSFSLTVLPTARSSST